MSELPEGRCHLATAPKAASISLLPASDAGRIRALLLAVTHRRRVALDAVCVCLCGLRNSGMAPLSDALFCTMHGKRL